MGEVKYIGIDLDGTVADSTGLAARYMQDHFDKDPLIASDSFEEMFDVSTAEVCEFWDIYAQRLWRECKPIRGAVRVIREISKSYPIMIVTRRFIRDKRITIDWLDEFCIPHDVVHFLGKTGVSKGDFPPIQECHCYIDDEVGNAICISDAKVPVILFKKDIDHPRVICVNGWREIEELILLKRSRRLVK